MTRVNYNLRECDDKRAAWQTTPCLCDCHYRGPVCGDADASFDQPRRIRITRKARKPE